jgi:hypothetical protein
MQFKLGQMIKFKYYDKDYEILLFEGIGMILKSYRQYNAYDVMILKVTKKNRSWNRPIAKTMYFTEGSIEELPVMI